MSTLVLVPTLVFGVSEPTGTIGGQLVPDCAPDCEWEHLIQLGSNILNFLVYLSIMAAAVMFAYAGFLYMSDGGSGSKKGDAKNIFGAVVIGIIIILTAWLAVDTLLKSLTDKGGVKEWGKSSRCEPLLHSRV